MQTVDDITDFSTITYNESLITEIIKRDDEITRQAIKDYFRQKYPKENLRFNFLDEEIVDEIIKLGISEYLKRQNFVVDLNKGKTADEMFKELGYKKFNKIHDFENIKYYKDDDNILYFDEKDKSFYKSGEYDSMCDDITMQELKAINKKCEELGWI